MVIASIATTLWIQTLTNVLGLARLNAINYCQGSRQGLKALVWVLLLFAVPAGAQERFPRHNITVSNGVGLPRGEINEYFASSYLLGVSYGYRFHRYLQADVGFDTTFGAARVDRYVDSPFGYQRIRDFQHFVPFGGRGILPLANGRVLISGGGGGVWMRYREAISQPSQFVQLTCPQCLARSGAGYYALGSVKFTNRWQRIWFGTTAKIVRGETEGLPFGGLDPFRRTKDHWLFLTFDIGFGL
jgi:hypothetical protein